MVLWWKSPLLIIAGLYLWIPIHEYIDFYPLVANFSHGLEKAYTKTVHKHDKYELSFEPNNHFKLNISYVELS